MRGLLPAHADPRLCMNRCLPNYDLIGRHSRYDQELLLSVPQLLLQATGEVPVTFQAMTLLFREVSVA
jgi:hypothetical protein